MKICIDMRPALSHSTGVGVYLQSLVKALARVDSENEYHLFSSSWKERFPGVEVGPNFHVRDKYWPVRILNYSWHRRGWPSIEWLLGTNFDVVHSPGPLLVPSRHAHRVTTVHDLYFYFHPEHTEREIRRDYAALIRKHCEMSDAIIAISDYTKQQLVDHLKVHSSRVYTIRHGTDPFFQERVSQEAIREVWTRFGITPPYFLFVGAREPRKNIPALLDAFSGIPGNCSLVLAGPSGKNDPAGSPRIIYTGYVPRQVLRCLYQGALALIMPSLDEGFGLPLLEAMAAGLPVTASAIPAFAEVAGDAYYPFNMNLVESIREAMSRMLSDAPLRQSLVEKGYQRLPKFSWDEAARKTLELYRNL